MRLRASESCETQPVGLATTLVELCEDFTVTMEIDEIALPIASEVKGACDIVVFDPMYLANEGKVIIIAAKQDEKKIIEILGKYDEGKNAKVIGRVKKGEKGSCCYALYWEVNDHYTDFPA
jgi:hydrogenase expression/formation protein HypE